MNVPHWFSRENVRTENGKLILEARFEPSLRTFVSDWETNPWTWSTRQLDFTSGEVNSRYRYGKGLYVAKCKIPSGSGNFFPAFWLYGQDGPSSNSNELDIFEYWDNDWEKWRVSLHKHNSLHCSTNHSTPSATEFLEYSMAWEQFNIFWSREDVGLVRNSPRWSTTLGQALNCNNIPDGLKLRNLDYPNEPPVPCNVIFDLAIRPLPSWYPLPTQFYPAALEIEYMRYYRRVPCLGSEQIVNLETYMSAVGEYNFITANDLDMGTSSQLTFTEQFECVATDFIQLSAGFEAHPGSDFIARIGASNCGLPYGGGGSQGSGTAPIILGLNDFVIKPIPLHSNTIDIAPSNTPASFSLFDLTGKRLCTSNSSRESVLQNCNELNSDWYILITTTNDRVRTERVFHPWP